MLIFILLLLVRLTFSKVTNELPELPTTTIYATILAKVEKITATLIPTIKICSQSY